MLVLKELLESIHDANKTIDDIKAFDIKISGALPDSEYRFRGVAVDISSIPADLEYDPWDSYQELYGHVLFEDNTWLEREDFNGPELWFYKKPPTVEDLLGY